MGIYSVVLRYEVLGKGVHNWEFLEGFSSSGYFTLFSPQSGPHTISEQLGTSGWVLVGFWSIRTLPIDRQA